MCGFSGEATFDGTPASVSAVNAMTGNLAPRGPDGSGLHAQGRVAFGHRRLKIIDLTDRAQQPMIDPALGLALAFNGCIYNYRVLRGELEGLGYSFFSDGDTEVVLKAYHAWGTDCVRRFNGMFAFAIHERDSGRLVLARDRLGIKPLYLSETTGGRRIRFASSLPALVAAGDVDTAIDPVALHHYMSFHAVVPPPYTMLKGVRKLPPATVAVFEADGSGATRPTGGSISPAAAKTRSARSRTGRTRSSASCARRCRDAWSPTCRSACCCRAGSTRA
jgi:asparagine synthase (glutamine-hydrolysing)